MTTRCTASPPLPRSAGRPVILSAAAAPDRVRRPVPALSWLLPGLALAFQLLAAPAAAQTKERLLEDVHGQLDASWKLACEIWELAEPGYQETQSSERLAAYLQAAGFEVRFGLAGIPTAFQATVGSGTPVLGLLGEFDALPGLSQEAVPQRRPREDGGYGHGCGHHLFGAASAAAAVALAQQIKAGHLTGTVRFYGCPAEEGGAAKTFMVRDGLFRGCDAVLHWHPSSVNSGGDRSSLARIAVKFRFRGKSAHAAGAPEQGRSALDAVELTNHAAQLMREHTPEGTRIHHVITQGGGAPNVVPDFAEVYYYVRHPQSSVVRGLYRRLVLCARAGALATETELEIVHEGGIAEILPNNVLAQVSLTNLRQLNNLRYDQQEAAFAARIQQTLETPRPLDQIHTVLDVGGQVGMGSTDVGDVSWTVPTTGFTTACWVPGTPGHSWQAVACGRTTIGRQGMQLASRVLAATAWDLLQNAQLLVAARQELDERLGNRPYQSLLEPGQKPPLDYRRPGSR